MAEFLSLLQNNRMAISNKTITNQKTGQTFRFIKTAKDTGGALLEIESGFRAHSMEPPPHFHPYQSEDFIILEGELTVKMDGEIRTFKKGETFYIPANKIHSMWNRSSQQTIVNWQTKPAMQSEQLFETIVGLANDGQTDATGKPALLQAALTIPAFHNEFRLVNPPMLVQKIVFSILKPFALLSGKRALYKKYID